MSGARPLAWRAAGLLVIVLVGLAAVTQSLALALSTRVPDLARRWNPWTAAALAQSANLIVQRQQTPAALAEARARAVEALRLDATNVTAMSVLGLATRDDAVARRALTVTESYSRRNLPAQLFLIEDAVRRDDVPAVLRHYDIALRTNRSAAVLLFPVLVDAASDPALQPEIARALAKRPPWGALYLQQLAQSGKAPLETARLFTRLAALGVSAPAPAQDALYARLVQTRGYDAAWALYARANPRADRGGVRNGGFADAPDNPAPFDWMLSDDPAISGRLERAESDAGRLEFDVAAGEAGEVARQLLLLRPGAHRLAVAYADIEVPGDVPAPLVQVGCDGLREPLLRLPLASGSSRAAGAFTVPATGCPAQWVALVVNGTDAPSAVTGTLLRVAVD